MPPLAEDVLDRLLGPVRPLVKGVEDALLGTSAPAPDRQVIGAALRKADRRGMYAAMQSVMLRRPSLLPLLPALPAPALLVAVTSGRPTAHRRRPARQPACCPAAPARSSPATDTSLIDAWVGLTVIAGVTALAGRAGTGL